ASPSLSTTKEIDMECVLIALVVVLTLVCVWLVWRATRDDRSCDSCRPSKPQLADYVRFRANGDSLELLPANTQDDLFVVDRQSQIVLQVVKSGGVWTVHNRRFLSQDGVRAYVMQWLRIERDGDYGGWGD